MLGIGLPVGRHMENAAQLQFTFHQFGKRRLNDPALIMTRFVPWVREKQLHHAQGVIGDHRVQHFYRIVAHNAQILHALFFSRRQTGADARRVHFNAEEILLRLLFRHRHQRSAHTKTNLQRDGRFTAKQRGKIERRIVKFNAHHRPNGVQRVLLTFSQAALTTDEAANTAQRTAVFIEFRRYDVVFHKS